MNSTIGAEHMKPAVATSSSAGRAGHSRISNPSKLNCGCENRADYNAAKNIGVRYLRRNQTGGSGGAPLGVRLNSGTLNANGGYSPAAASGQNGSPRRILPL
jgi:transposase